MKNVKLFILSGLFLSLSIFATAQSSKQSFKVSGECGMCKKKIESAAKKAGATYASWNVDSKMLTVEFADSKTDVAKIEKKIADAGYDTKDFKASEAAYKKLDACCQYERTEEVSGSDAKTEHADCMKDGKCTKDMKDCKETGKKDCCKKAS
jgi:periplasmic mercuric ion binding protein